MRALELEGSGLAELDADMEQSMRAMAAGAEDVPLLADRWVKSDLPLRITWLEHWLTRRVRDSLGELGLRPGAHPERLPAVLHKPKMRALFRLLDGARDLRRLGSTGMNQLLALEALLLLGRTALAD